MPRNTTTRKVSRFRAGAKALRATNLNKIVDAVNQPITGVNQPIQPKPRGKAGGAPVLVLTLVSHQDDHLVCEDADLVEYLVAKPYELRRTPFENESIGGVTYTFDSSFPTSQERTATSDSNPSEIELQYITPAYTADHEIFAVKVQGNTGVPDPDNPSQMIEYIEIDQGRAFAWDDS